MITRIIKASTPIIAILSMASLGTIALADEIELQHQEERNITSSSEGSYARFSYYRDNDYGSASLYNKSYVYRKGLVVFTGFDNEGQSIGANTNSRNLDHAESVATSASYDGLNPVFSEIPSTIEYYGALYYHTLPGADILEVFWETL